MRRMATNGTEAKKIGMYLILQGVGDGSQPLISRHYGEKNFEKLKSTRKLAYGLAMFLSVIGCVIMYVTKGSLGILFGALSVNCFLRNK